MSKCRVMIAVLVLIACIISIPAEALPIKQISAGGVLTPNADYKENSWRTGITVGVGTFLKIRKNIFGTAEVNYFHFTLRDARAYDGISYSSVKGGTTNIMDLTVNFKARLFPVENKNSPFIILGGGMLYKTQSDIRSASYRSHYVFKPKDEFVPVYNFGFGVDLTGRNNSGFFLEAKFVFADLKYYNISFFPIRAGLIF